MENHTKDNVCRALVKSSHKGSHGFLVCTFLSHVCRWQTIVNCCVTFSLQTQVCQTPPVSYAMHSVSYAMHLVFPTSPKKTSRLMFVKILHQYSFVYTAPGVFQKNLHVQTHVSQTPPVLSAHGVPTPSKMHSRLLL